MISALLCTTSAWRALQPRIAVSPSYLGRGDWRADCGYEKLGLGAYRVQSYAVQCELKLTREFGCLDENPYYRPGPIVISTTGPLYRIYLVYLHSTYWPPSPLAVFCRIILFYGLLLDLIVHRLRDQPDTEISLHGGRKYSVDRRMWPVKGDYVL